MLIIAHRGNGQGQKENTLTAIKSSQIKGIDMVEIDVRTTADDVPVLHHNQAIAIDGLKTPIDKLNFKKLKQANKDILTLEQALETKQTKLLLEIKPEANIRPIIQVIKKSKHKELMVTSFNYNLLKQIKNELPNAQLAVLDKWSGIRSSIRARKLGTNIIIINHRWLWGYYIKLVKRSGLKLFTYTLNNPEKAAQWKKLGLKGVITDTPSNFL